MPRYIFSEGVVEGARALESQIKRAYEDKVRPKCLCKPEPVPMYIAKIGERYIIKRMPNTGHLHDPGCESYEVPPELSGRADLQDTAIREDHTTGVTNLRVNFALTKTTASRKPPTRSDEKKTMVEAEPTKMTLLSLLHCLYDDAGFNRWSPKMEGKRTWYVIQKHLMQAAENKMVKGSALVSILMIPEPFSVERKELLCAQHRKFFASLKSEGKVTQLGICIGEVKKFEAGRYNHKLFLKHMVDSPIFFNDGLYKSIQKNFAFEIAMHQENDQVHLFAIGTVHVSPSGNPMLEAISMMLVDSHWLPFENREEMDVLGKSVAEKRHFIKGLRYNLSPSKVIASFLYTDTGEQPTTLYVVPGSAQDAFYDELQKVTESSTFLHATFDINQNPTIELPKQLVKERTQTNGQTTNLSPDKTAAPAVRPKQSMPTDSLDLFN